MPALAQVLGQRAIGPFALELVACLLEKKHVLLPLDTGEHLIGVCATVTGRGIAVRAPPVAAGTYRRGREPRNNGLSLGDG